MNKLKQRIRERDLAILFLVAQNQEAGKMSRTQLAEAVGLTHRQQVARAEQRMEAGGVAVRDDEVLTLTDNGKRLVHEIGNKHGDDPASWPFEYITVHRHPVMKGMVVYAINDQEDLGRGFAAKMDTCMTWV